MKIKIKNECCSFCGAELVVSKDTLTCEDGCELKADGWHKDTQKQIDEAMGYLETL